MKCRRPLMIRHGMTQLCSTISQKNGLFSNFLKSGARNWTKFPLVQSDSPVGKLAKKLTSPSQQYRVVLPNNCQTGSLCRTNSEKLNSSFPDCWSSQKIGQGQFQALQSHFFYLLSEKNYGVALRVSNFLLKGSRHSARQRGSCPLSLMGMMACPF